jgi:MFS transporter, DHA2 family, multidrug resistance protein
MINLFRKIGASVGISMVTTLTQRRAQIHEDTFSMHLSSYDPALRSQLAGLGNNLFRAGMSHADASQQAIGRLYQQTQASTEAYLDTLKILAIICFCMLPLLLVVKKNGPHAKKVAVH